jgi:hypothetical protein
MPISTSSFGDKRDKIYDEFTSADTYERQTMAFAGLSVELAESMFKKLGGGVAEKHRRVEGVGWQAEMRAVNDGTEIEFAAHDELLDDLIRRFEEMVDKAL